LLSELSGTDEVTLVGTESHSESCTTHGVCKAIVEVAKGEESNTNAMLKANTAAQVSAQREGHHAIQTGEDRMKMIRA
jgi:hypothetical protein